MNSLVIFTAAYPHGQGESFLEAEVSELARRVKRIVVVPLRRPAGTRPLPSNVTLSSVSLTSPTTFWRALVQLFRCRGDLLWLAFMLVRDIRHIVRNLASAVIALAHTHELGGTKPDHLHAHWLTHPATAAMIVSRLTHVGFSVTAHRYDLYANNLVDPKVRSAKFVRCISRHGYALLAKQVRNPGRLVTIPMGVEIPVLNVRASRADQVPASFALVCPAALLPVKGHRYLLSAIAQLDPITRSQLTVHLMGDGPLLEKLTGQARELGIQQHVRFHGHVSHAQLLGMYERGEAHCVALASVDDGNGLHEGVPVSLIEAMAYGVPVISTTTGGIPELVMNGVTGVAVPERDAEALAGGIQFQFDRPAAVKAMALKAHNHVLQRHAIDVTVSALVAQMEAEATSRTKHASPTLFGRFNA